MDTIKRTRYPWLDLRDENGQPSALQVPVESWTPDEMNEGMEFWTLDTLAALMSSAAPGSRRVDLVAVRDENPALVARDPAEAYLGPRLLNCWGSRGGSSWFSDEHRLGCPERPAVPR